MVDFSKLGRTVVGQIKPPPVPPGGTYYGVVKSWKWAESRWPKKGPNGQPVIGPDGQPEKETQVHFTLSGVEFGEDIDEGERAGVKLSDRIFVAEVPADSERDQFFLQELLSSMGIHGDGQTTTFDTLLPNTIGQPVMFEGVVRQLDKGPMFNIKKMRARM